VGDNLIMLDKRTEGVHGTPGHSNHEAPEGFNTEIPPMPDAAQDLPF